DALINNCNKLRIARANHPLRIHEAVHVNRGPAAIHEHEVRVSEQPEMVGAVSLDEELFRMLPQTEHLTVTRSELFLVYRRGLICVHVRLARARARTHPRFILSYLLGATLNVRLFTYVCARLRFCLRFGRLLLLRGTHLLALRRRSRLRVFRLRIGLWLRLA